MEVMIGEEKYMECLVANSRRNSKKGRKVQSVRLPQDRTAP